MSRLVTLDPDVIRDAQAMLRRAVDRLHALRAVVNNEDTASQETAAARLAEALANIDAATARLR